MFKYLRFSSVMSQTGTSFLCGGRGQGELSLLGALDGSCPIPVSSMVHAGLIEMLATTLNLN